MSGPGLLTKGRAGGLAIALALCPLVSGPVAAQAVQPAELPPASYRGLQYVDTQGCVFLRAGTAAETLWVPRVTAGGKQLCGYPPSGRRVPVVGEPGVEGGAFALEGEEAAAPVEAASAPESVVAAPPKATAAEASNYVVAMGSFGFASNVEKAVAGGEALGLPVVTGQLNGGEQGLVTVFAGPFDSKAAAEAALRKLRKAGFPDAVLMAL
jgi:hypothetical protein